MEKLISRLKYNYQVLIFAVLGCVLIAFPAAMTGIVSSIGGFALIACAVINIVICVRFPNSQSRPGRSLVYLAIGIVLLLKRGETLGILGILWAMLSLKESAEEINEFVRTRRISPFRALWLVVSVVLAIMLMHDPFEHFALHVRVLGAEMIVSALIRWKKGVPEESEA